MTSPGIGVNAQVFVDTRDTERVLDQLADNISPQSLQKFLYTQTAPYLQMRAEERFQNEGDDVVGRWSPLAASTLAIRASQGFSTTPINVRTRRMKHFITGSFGQVTQLGDISILTWPNPANRTLSLEEKLRTAQVGKAQPSTPARPVLGVNQRDNIFITALLAAHVMSGL